MGSCLPSRLTHRPEKLGIIGIKIDFLVQSSHQFDAILGSHSLVLGGRPLRSVRPTLASDFLEQLERAQVVGVSGPGEFRVGQGLLPMSLDYVSPGSRQQGVEILGIAGQSTIG